MNDSNIGLIGLHTETPRLLPRRLICQVCFSGCELPAALITDRSPLTRRELDAIPILPLPLRHHERHRHPVVLHVAFRNPAIRI
jgi:hypothetical protein